MNTPKRVGILCGGKSAEHEVSLQSAKNILDAIDTNKYEPIIIGITKQGSWRLYPTTQFLKNADDPVRISLAPKGIPVVLALGDQNDHQLMNSDTAETLPPLDIIFPMLHGTYGEDGTVQGLLKLAGIPFVGAATLGSAVGMDKDVMKRLLRDAGIPIAAYKTLRTHQTNKPHFDDLCKALGSPLFVKPANMGSSVGVSRVSSEAELVQAIKRAFMYDQKIIIEEAIEGRELECGVLGNSKPSVSVLGEVMPQLSFYSYEAKYLDDNGAEVKIPADLPPHIVDDLQTLAIKTFKTLECSGLARVDFFLTAQDEIIVNEINTLPGFTEISMYPKLWNATGVSYKELISRLLELAVEKAAEHAMLTTHAPRL